MRRNSREPSEPTVTVPPGVLGLDGERERERDSYSVPCTVGTSRQLERLSEAAMLEVGTKMVHTDPWRADELDHAAERLDWAAKDAHKPAGTFDADYASLCQ